VTFPDVGWSAKCHPVDREGSSFTRFQGFDVDDGIECTLTVIAYSAFDFKIRSQAYAALGAELRVTVNDIQVINKAYTRDTRHFQRYSENLKISTPRSTDADFEAADLLDVDSVLGLPDPVATEFVEGDFTFDALSLDT